MAECDAAIGRLVAALRQAGVYDETLIILTADHGDMLGDHWLWAADGYFDAAFHIPLIVRDPATPARVRGSRVTAFTESVDIMPTILERAGLSPPPRLDGRSLAPFLEGAAPADWRTAAHWAYDFRDGETPGLADELGLAPEQANLCVLRERDAKYVHFAGLPSLYFDIDADQDERFDRAADPAFAERVSAAAQRLLSWRLGAADRALTHLGSPPTACAT